MEVSRLLAVGIHYTSLPLRNFIRMINKRNPPTQNKEEVLWLIKGSGDWYHVRYTIALGKARTPAPIMAVTLWNAACFQLA